MSISKEVRTGLLVAISLSIFFVGYYFLKGSNIFSGDKLYTCYYANAEGLQNSSSIQINGLNVGRVSQTQLDPQGVKVILAIDKSSDIPVGTVASIASFDLLGSKMIRLDLGKGPGLLPAGATLPTASEAGLVDKISDQLTPRLYELKETITKFNTVLTGVNAIVGEENQAALAGAIASIKTTADNLSQLSGALGKESGEITSVIHNANSITGNLAKSNDTIQHILTNVSNVTRQLSNAPIQKTLSELQKASGDLQSIMNKINNNEGSLGLLINNKDVYNNLNSSLHSLNSLMDDVKAHPSRYINVNVFGGKK